MSKASNELTAKDRREIISTLNNESEVLITKHEVFFMPSMGKVFTFIDNGLATNRWVSGKGHDILFIKISDKRSTHTAGLKSNIAYSDKAGTQKTGKPVLVADNFISVYRFAGKTFHNPDIVTVAKEMTEQLRARMAVYMKNKEVDKEAFKLMRSNMNDSIKEGRAFKTSLMVTRNKKSGMLCMWRNWETKDGYKMVMTAFKHEEKGKWVPFTNHTEKEGYKAAGRLDVNHCTSIQAGSSLGCAMKALVK